MSFIGTILFSFKIRGGGRGCSWGGFGLAVSAQVREATGALARHALVLLSLSPATLSKLAGLPPV